jgi:hypothetical protein
VHPADKLRVLSIINLKHLSGTKNFQNPVEAKKHVKAEELMQEGLKMVLKDEKLSTLK